MSGLDRYTLVRRVGVGGMGEVWKAKVLGPAGFEKIVAIKKILPYRLAEKSFVDMFVAEAKLVAQLVHPNIVQVYDFGLEEGPNDVDRNYFLELLGQDGCVTARVRSDIESALLVAAGLCEFPDRRISADSLFLVIRVVVLIVGPR